MKRRAIVATVGTVGVASIAGCGSSDTDETDSTDGTDEPESANDSDTNESESTEEEEEPESTSNDEIDESLLIPIDPITDLLPDAEDLPDDGWSGEKETNEGNATGTYEREVEAGTQRARVFAAGFEDIEGAEDRYDTAVSNAESENLLGESISDGVDEGFTVADASAMFWRDRNVVFQTEVALFADGDPTGLPDLMDQVQTSVQENWREVIQERGGLSEQEEDEEDDGVPDERKHGVGESFTVENIRYTVTNLASGQVLGNSVLNEEADGMFVVVEMELTNITNETITISSDLFSIISNGNEYEPASDAMTAFDVDDTFDTESILLKDLGPDLTTTGAVVFDVPDGATVAVKFEPDGFLSSAEPHFVIP